MIKFINKQTGLPAEGQYLIEAGQVWEYQFGSYDDAIHPTRAWNGEMWLVDDKITAIIEPSMKST